MDEEPLGLRFGRYFLFLGFILFLLFALSDYTGQPRFSWLFWAFMLLTLGFILYQRGRIQLQEGVGMGPRLPEAESPERKEKQESQRRRFLLRRRRRS